MREIKFRAFSKAKKKWYSVYQLKWAMGDLYAQVDLEKDLWMRSSIMNLVQFTGLLDKNGTEIYEGHIVKNYDGNTCCVEWKDPTWLSPFSYRGGMENELDNETVEVVGNIYDNPELLEHS